MQVSVILYDSDLREKEIATRKINPTGRRFMSLLQEIARKRFGDDGWQIKRSQNVFGLKVVHTDGRVLELR